jgi:hypothetical protein
MAFCILFFQSVLPLILGGTPASLAIKMLSQWYQWIKGGKFSYYDFGRSRNLQKYGSPTPPNYDLTKVTTRIVNMWGQNDWLSVPRVNTFSMKLCLRNVRIVKKYLFYRMYREL